MVLQVNALNTVTYQPVFDPELTYKSPDEVVQM